MLIKITRHKRKFKFVRPYYWKITIIDPQRPKEWPTEVGYLDRATGPNHQPIPWICITHTTLLMTELICLMICPKMKQQKKHLKSRKKY